MRLSLILVLLLTACSACAGFSPNIGQTPRQQHDAMVLIKKTCSDGRVGLGSGLMISEDRVITARHVIKCDVMPGVPIQLDAARIEVFASPDDTLDAVLEVETSDLHDLARLQLPNKKLGKYFTPIRVAPMPGIGKKVCAVSAWPRPSYKCGEAQFPIRGKLLVNFAVERGNSGSAIFNEYGNLVGIITNQFLCETGSTGICGGYGTPLIGFSWLIPAE